MYMIIAIIKPFKLDEVRNALLEMEIQGVTVTDVKGFGRQKGHTELYRGAEYNIDFIPKAKLEIAVTADQLEGAIKQIQESAFTGEIGDGKIFVYQLDQAVRIRTNETGDSAI